MFMKKNLIVKGIAMVMMIVMIAAFALTACNNTPVVDNTANEEALAALSQQIKDLQTQLDAAKDDAEKDALKAEIDKLNEELKNFTANMAEVSAQLATLKAELAAVHATGYTSVHAWKFAAETKTAVEDTADAYGAYTVAVDSLNRATTVEEAKKIVEDYKALLAGLETVDVTFVNTLADLDKTIADAKAITDLTVAENVTALKTALLTAYELVTELNTLDTVVKLNNKATTDALTAPEKAAEKAVRVAIYEAIYGKHDGTTKNEDKVITKAQKSAEEVAKLFTANGAAILKADLATMVADVLTNGITLKTVDTIADTTNVQDDPTFYESYTAINATEAATAWDSLKTTKNYKEREAVLARLTVLADAKTAADAIVVRINALLAEGAIKADITTKNAVEALYADIYDENGVGTATADGWYVQFKLEKGDDYYNAENEKMILNADGKGYADVKAAFDAVVAALTAKVKTFTDAVDAVGEVTYLSADAIKAAFDAYKALGLTQAEIDGVLEDDEEGNPIDVIGTYNELADMQVAYNEIKAAIDAVKAAAKAITDSLQFKVTHNSETVDYTGEVYPNGVLVDAIYAFTTDDEKAYAYEVEENKQKVTKYETLTKAEAETQYDAMIAALKAKVEALVAAIEKVTAETELNQDAAAIDAEYTDLVNVCKFMLAKQAAFDAVDALTGLTAQQEVKKAHWVEVVAAIKITDTCTEDLDGDEDTDCFDLIAQRVAAMNSEING